MSSAIWTQCGRGSEIRRLQGKVWRSVEDQHRVATLKLVDSAADQALLESMLEGSKPPAEEFAGRHYLIFTPFRYPPLRHGSRFGRAYERGIFYASSRISSALAETAYYRLLFLAGSKADLAPLDGDFTTFRVQVRARRGLDLTRPPFSAFSDRISNPAAYRSSQALGGEMRGAGVEAFRYRSARDPDGGNNLGVFAIGAIRDREPQAYRFWHCSARPDHVSFLSRQREPVERLDFARETFLVGGRLPAPALR